MAKCKEEQINQFKIEYFLFGGLLFVGISMNSNRYLTDIVYEHSFVDLLLYQLNSINVFCFQILFAALVIIQYYTKQEPGNLPKDSEEQGYFKNVIRNFELSLKPSLEIILLFISASLAAYIVTSGKHLNFLPQNSSTAICIRSILMITVRLVWVCYVSVLGRRFGKEYLAILIIIATSFVDYYVYIVDQSWIGPICMGEYTFLGNNIETLSGRQPNALYYAIFWATVFFLTSIVGIFFKKRRLINTPPNKKRKIINFPMVASILISISSAIITLHFNMQVHSGAMFGHLDKFYYGYLWQNVIMNSVFPLIPILGIVSFQKKYLTVGARPTFSTILKMYSMANIVTFLPIVIMFAGFFFSSPHGAFVYPFQGNFGVEMVWKTSVTPIVVYLINTEILVLSYSTLSAILYYQNSSSYNNLLFPIMLYNIVLYNPFNFASEFVWNAIPSYNYDVAGSMKSILEQSIGDIIPFVIAIVLMAQLRKRERCYVDEKFN